MNEIQGIPCDLCGNTIFDLIFYHDLLDGPLVKCKNCGLVQVNTRGVAYLIKNGQPVTERATAYKRTSKVIRSKLFYEPDIEQGEEKYKIKNWNDRLEKIRGFKKTGKLLEIGGGGQFLSLARNHGYEIYGVEPLKSSCKHAKVMYDIDILPKTLQEANFDTESFDIVAMFHVIEHVSSPSELCAEVYRVLKNEGLFVIETPKIGIWFKLLKKRWRQFIPGHYWFFNSITIQKLLTSKLNFRILEITSVGKSVSFRFLLNRIERLIGRSTRVILKALEIFGLEEKTIYINPGDIMLVIAKKEEKSL